MNNEGTEL